MRTLLEDREKRRAYEKTWRTKTKGHYKDRLRKRSKIWRMKKYNFSEELLQTLFELQEYKCGGCDKEFIDVLDLQMDHNHETNEPRGLLCRECNTLLGHVEKFWTMPKLDAYISYSPVEKLKNKAINDKIFEDIKSRWK